jgi:16S rRNA (guanine1207-N2)-methyltransferase
MPRVLTRGPEQTTLLGGGDEAPDGYIRRVPETIVYERLRDVDLRLATRPGVFAHNGLDAGTRLLINAMRVSPTARVLDLGCGAGAIGIVAAKLALRGSAVLVDSDIRATRLAQRNLTLNNITNAEVVLGDGVHDLPPKARFNVVASNPPTHSGREVLDEMVAGAYHVLRPRGQLYMVINRLLSLKKEIETVFGAAETVDRSKGYIVVRAVKQPRLHGSDEFEYE